jgi:hypothetical protein
MSDVRCGGEIAGFFHQDRELIRRRRSEAVGPISEMFLEVVID